MKKMNEEDFRKLGITTKKRGNYWEIFFDERLALFGLSDDDFEIFKQKSAKEVIEILFPIQRQLHAF